MSFSLKEKSSESSKSTVKNLLTCPICYKTSEDENVKIEILKCGHFICKQCIDTMKEKSDNVKKLKCPICQAKLKEVNTAYIWFVFDIISIFIFVNTIYIFLYNI